MPTLVMEVDLEEKDVERLITFLKRIVKDVELRFLVFPEPPIYKDKPIKEYL